MPSQAELDEERANEDKLKDADSQAADQEHSGNSDGAEKGYEKDGDGWSQTGESYFRKSEEAGRTPREAAEYRCRAGQAWLNAAKDFEKAAALAHPKAKADALQDRANDCFKHAAYNFEVCAEEELELGDPESAAASFAQADSCFLFWKYGAKKIDASDPDVERGEDGHQKIKKRLREMHKLQQEKIEKEQKPKGNK